VAIFRSEDGIEILRDPSGGLPCYYLGDGDVLFFASDVDLFLQAKLYCPSVDWDDLAWQLYAAGLPSEFTALAGIRELQQGTVLNNECGAIRKEALWSPWAFASGDADLSDHEREEQLRRVVQNCISAWASAHRKILVGVSGGLDSSIVWSCASQTKALVEGITLATEDPSGDERVFARALFEADQAELHEAFFLLGDIDLGKSCAQHLPRPLGRSHELAYAKMVRRYLKGTSSDCFFTGNGGDNVFSYSQSAAAVTDRILAQGAGIGAFRTLIDICRMVGCNPLEAALNAGKAFRRRKSYIWQPDKLFLAKEVADASARRELTHPWLHAPSGSLPGKIGHVARLLRIQLHLEGFERTTTPPVINPLMSQPIVEECLGIQSWDWCSGGINRSVARRAFAKSLPPAILNRQSKSGPDSFCVELIERNRAEIRSRLLDGQLVGRGLINGSQLEGALAGEGLVRGSDYVRILSLLDTEAWIIGWQERRTDSFPIG
jgi:asparagine synthase (glutamine-hydrolysing)